MSSNGENHGDSNDVNNNNNGNSGNNDPHCSGNELSNNPLPPIVSFTQNETINDTGLEIVNTQGQTADGSIISHTTFNTTHPELYDPIITEDLQQVTEIYNDGSDPNSQNAIVLSQIKDYAGKIKCSDFHGKGTIDDYSVLFNAAAQIANETKHMQLDVDIEGFTEFGSAADDLSELFNRFIVKLQNVNIINDLTFLQSVASALQKIYNLSEVFGRFKETILTTTTIQMPKTAHETRVVLEDVMGELNCAMKYIGHFVSPENDTEVLVDADLSVVEKNIINKAVDTIANWNTICEHGVSISMTNNTDIQYIKQSSNTLKTTTLNLKSLTQRLKDKMGNIEHC